MGGLDARLLMGDAISRSAQGRAALIGAWSTLAAANTDAHAMDKALPVSAEPTGWGFLLMAAGGLIWVIGGNVIVALQFRRRGMRWDRGMALGMFAKVSLNFREVLWLIGVAVLAGAFVVIGGMHLKA